MAAFQDYCFMVQYRGTTIESHRFATFEKAQEWAFWNYKGSRYWRVIKVDKPLEDSFKPGRPANVEVHQ